MAIALKVRHLQKSEIEAAVRELGRQYEKARGRKLVPPVPVDDIIEFHLKLDFRFDDLSKLLGLSDVLGATWFDERRIVVDSRLEREVGRYSFTLAHEIGHWILHRPLYEMEKAAPMLLPPEKPQGPAVICRMTNRREPAEWQADQFAGHLLMPAANVRETIQSLLSRIASLRQELDAGKFADDVRFRELAASVIAEGSFTNVSNEAMRVRLSELGIVRPGRGLNIA